MQVRGQAESTGWEVLQCIVTMLCDGKCGCMEIRLADRLVRLVVKEGEIGIVASTQDENDLLLELATIFQTANCSLDLTSPTDEGMQKVNFWRAVELFYLRKHGRERLQQAAKEILEATVSPNAATERQWTIAAKAWPILQSVGTGRTVRSILQGQKTSLRDLIALLVAAEISLLTFSLGGNPYEPLLRVNVDTPGENMLSTETALEQAKAFMRRNWLGAARYRFEDLLQVYPEHAEAKSYVAWIDFKSDKKPSAELIDQALMHINEGILACPRNADLHTFRGMLLRLNNRIEESVKSFAQALLLEPAHPQARYEKEVTSLRLESACWPDVDVERVKVNSKIIIQRRIGRHVQMYSFQRDEVRLGSGDNDDVIVSAAVLPQVAKRHCTVIAREGRLYIRRNASLGRVWLNGAEIDIRKDVQVGPEDSVRLGDVAVGPSLEFRVFNLTFLHDLELRGIGGLAA